MSTATATSPCPTVADFLDAVARIMVYEHGHDIVTVYDNYLTFEGYILDVEFWGHPSVSTPAPCCGAFAPRMTTSTSSSSRVSPALPRMTRLRCWSSRLPRCTRPTSTASPAALRYNWAPQ